MENTSILWKTVEKNAHCGKLWKTVDTITQRKVRKINIVANVSIVERKIYILYSANGFDKQKRTALHSAVRPNDNKLKSS